MEKIILVMICALTLTLGACEKKEAKKPSEVKPPEASGIISNKVPQAVVDLATGPLTEFGKDKIVVKAVSLQNAEAKTSAQIQEMDKKWQAAKKEGKTEPFMKALMENSCAKQLKKLMAEYPSVTEIFVTDNQGANVCQTGLTGDYWQGDEAKFKEVFKKGILVSHPKVEDGMNITQVSVPVLMKARHIGTMTIGVNIDKVPAKEGAEPAKAESDKPAAIPTVAEQEAPIQEAEGEAPKATAGEQQPATEASAPVQMVTENVPGKEGTVEEKADSSQEKAPEKAALIIAQEAPDKNEKDALETTLGEPPSKLVAQAQESAAKVTEQVESVEDTTQKASEELETLPAQAEKIQQEAEEVQREVEQVAAQVKMVSEKVEKVSMDSQKVLEKARSAMDQVLKARAQLRDAADQIQKSAAMMTEKLAEIEIMTGVKTAPEGAPTKSE